MLVAAAHALARPRPASCRTSSRPRADRAGRRRAWADRRTGTTPSVPTWWGCTAPTADVRSRAGPRGAPRSSCAGRRVEARRAADRETTGTRAAAAPSGGVASVNSKPSRAAPNTAMRRVAGVGAGRARGRARAARSTGRAAAPSRRCRPGRPCTCAANTVVTLRSDWSGSAELGDHRPHRRGRHEPAVRHDRAVPFLADVGAVRAAGAVASLDRGSLLELRPGHRAHDGRAATGRDSLADITSAHDQRRDCSGPRVLRGVRQGRGADRARRVLHRRRRVPQHAGRSRGRPRGDPRPAQHVRHAGRARRVPRAQHRRRTATPCSPSASTCSVSRTRRSSCR